MKRMLIGSAEVTLSRRWQHRQEVETRAHNLDTAPGARNSPIIRVRQSEGPLGLCRIIRSRNNILLSYTTSQTYNLQ